MIATATADIHSEIENKSNFNILVVNIFDLAKKIHHFLKISNLSIKNTLKKLLGTNLVNLGQFYESLMSKKNISISFTVEIRINQPKKANYTRLTSILHDIELRFIELTS